MKLNARQRRLVEQNAHLVLPLAKRAKKLLPSSINTDELKSVGYQALCLCAITHQATLGPFDYWARLKIYGAMIDANKGKNYARRIQDFHMTPSISGSQKNKPEEYADGRGGRFDAPPFYDPPSTDANQEELAIERQSRHILAERLSDALRTLTRTERRLLEASDNSQTLGEIAEQLGVGITTVHRRRELIYAKLRVHLADSKTC